MSGLPVAGVVDAAGIEVAHKQTGASAVAARKGIKAGDVVVRLPGPSDPPRIGRCSIVRLVPWMAEPEAVITPVAVTIPTNATMAMAGIAPDRVLIQTVVTSVAVVAAIVVTTTPSATLPVVDPMGRSNVYSRTVFRVSRWIKATAITPLLLFAHLPGSLLGFLELSNHW